MKLTFEWDPWRGEGLIDKSDARFLVDEASCKNGDLMAVLDFLVDVQYETRRLYKRLLRAKVRSKCGDKCLHDEVDELVGGDRPQ
jgi:hypothetical protein